MWKSRLAGNAAQAEPIDADFQALAEFDLDDFGSAFERIQAQKVEMRRIPVTELEAAAAHDAAMAEPRPLVETPIVALTLAERLAANRAAAPVVEATPELTPRLSLAERLALQKRNA